MNTKKYLLPIIFVGIILVFYLPFLIGFKLPIPLDAVVGLYHPYRDLYAVSDPRGVPVKNPLITDPVRQTYIWKELAVSEFKNSQIPIWNPYEMSGKPLLANFQSSVFYPLNIFLFLSPFSFGWSIFIMLQSLLGGLFLYLYLRNLKLHPLACLFGSVALTFSGFFTSWLEWGTIVQTALWLPLILLAKDKLIEKWNFKWMGVLFFAEVACIFAGHLQLLFYIFCISTCYLIYRILEKTLGKKKAVFNAIKISIPFLITSVSVFLVAAVQLIPTLQYILLSNRTSDQNYKLIDGWFVPYKHLIQFLSPDFFGNPTTANYWGTWNYGEMVGYVGVVVLIFALIAVLARLNKNTFFYFLLLLLSLVFALPTIIGKLPFEFSLPFLSTAQPTRLLFLSCFSLSVLSASGVDYFIQRGPSFKRKEKLLVLISLLLIGITFAAIWLLVLTKNPLLFKNVTDNLTANRNLRLPTGIFALSSIIILVLIFLKKRNIIFVGIIVLFIISSLDLLRFTQKFNTFSQAQYLYPTTKVISFLKEQKGVFRIASADNRILPPNFSTYHRLQSIEGYDPLYLKSYGQYIAALQRNTADLTEPFGFNRIITPTNYSSVLYDLLNVKYVMSLNEIKSDKLSLVFEDGLTKVYQNKAVIDRVFFVDTIIFAEDNWDSVRQMYKYDMKKTAVVDKRFKDTINGRSFTVGKAQIENYSENKVVISTRNEKEGYLVLSDTFYPSWHVTIDGKEGKIIPTNLAFRGVIVPSGNHTVTFYTKLF